VVTPVSALSGLHCGQGNSRGRDCTATTLCRSRRAHYFFSSFTAGGRSCDRFSWHLGHGLLSVAFLAGLPGAPIAHTKCPHDDFVEFISFLSC
jgi:hypothetical protein